MAAPPKEGGIFAPNDIREMSAAFDRVLGAVHAREHALALIPAFDLRHRVAALILAAARNGPIEAGFLADRALCGLRQMNEPQALLELLPTILASPPRRASAARAPTGPSQRAQGS